MRKLLAIFALIFSLLSGVSAIALGQLNEAYWYSYCEANHLCNYFELAYNFNNTFRILLIVFMILAIICLIAYAVIYIIQELKSNKNVKKLL